MDPGCWTLKTAVPTLHSRGENDVDLRAAMVRRLHSRAVVSGSIVLPAVPAMIDDYMEMCTKTFSAVGVAFNDEERTQLRSALDCQLAAAFSASPRSQIVITYNSPDGLIVNYLVKAQWSSIEAAYDNWIATRQPPLFGSEPDAKVLALATAATDPSNCPILDIGAGTGRNTLELARRGHPVDALELTPKFADILRQESQHESLNVRIIERDIFSGTDDLRRDYSLILLSEVVSDFRSTDELRHMFELATQCLAQGGQLVFNAFVAKESFTLSDATRQLGQQAYSSMFSRSEIAAAVASQPLTQESDESVYDYEKSHQPTESWPPTGWYENWVNGQDVFDIERGASPMELRWFVYRKQG